MTYHKTCFSYVLWVVYTMLCAIFLIFAGNYICESYFADSLVQISSITVPVHGYALKIFGLLAVLAVIAVYWTIRAVSGQIRKKYAVKESTCRIMECVVVLAALTAGIFLRVVCAQDYIHLQNAAENSTQACVNGIEYFDRAVVTEQGTIEPLDYGSAYLYVACLSFVLSFLGNKVASAVLFQVFLQITGLVLAYLVTRKAAGRIPACTVLIYLSCSSGYLEMLRNLGPECLFFVLYLLGMLVLLGYVESYCGNRLRIKQALAGAVMTGILVGVLGYLDLTAFTILLVMTAIVTGRRRKTEDAQFRHPAGINAAALLTVLISCAVGVCGIIGIVSLCRGTGFVQEMETWVTLHIENTRTFGFRPLYPYSSDMLVFGILAASASFLIFEFYRSGREQNYMLWILFCIVVAPTPLAVFGVQPFGLISMYIWGVLAGLGLQNCMLGGKAKLIQRMIEEINQAAEEAERAEEVGRAEEKEKLEEAETIEEREKPEEAQQAEEKEEPEDIPAPKPRFLENPLPLPKKHVHRQMDYQYTVEEQDMKFDVEIREEDDFDI